jgi:hypothetical protein
MQASLPGSAENGALALARAVGPRRLRATTVIETG